jgi:diacylglycerol kinase family enzyme
MDHSVAVVINPTAGTPGSSQPAAVERLFDGSDVMILPAGPGRDVRRQTAEALDRGAGIVVAAGGDGTVSAVASVVAGTSAVLGVLPAGTLNHFAKDAGIPLDLEEAARTVCHGRVVDFDVAEVNGRVFINNSSLGFYPALVRRREMEESAGHGKWPAFFRALAAAFRRFPFLHVRLDAGGDRLERTTPLVFVGNNVYAVRGLRAGSRDSLTGGKLCVYVMPATGRIGLLRLAWGALAGTIESGSDFDALCATDVWIDSPRKRLNVAADGEVAAMATPLHYRIRPRGLRVLVP